MTYRSMAVAMSMALGCAAFSSVAWADEHEAEEPNWVPVETWTCDYRDGKGREDLDKVIDAWNDWMDDEDQHGYYAAIGTPQYYGEWPFDVAWLGAWADGNVMGTNSQLWKDEGGEIGAQFGEVVSCGSHTNFASLNLRDMGPPEEGDDTFVLTFSNCSFNDDVEFKDFMAAQEEWNAYAEENGIHGGVWMMFPVWGENDGSYDFKYVEGEDDHVQVGANWQKFADGHWRKNSELFNAVMDCDIGRVYDMHTVRRMDMDE